MKYSNKTIESLTDRLETEKNHLNNLDKKYKIELGSFLKRTLYKEKSYVLRKKELKGRIKKEKDIIKNIENTLSKNSIFPFIEGMNFLASAVSIIEQEEYIYKEFKLNDILLQTFTAVASNIQQIPLENRIGVIARKDFIQDFNESINMNNFNIKQELIQNNEKHIILSRESILELFNGKEVPKNIYQYFPYLTKICIDLIGMRIEYTELSYDEICEFYLQELQKQIKSNNNQKEKK